MSITVDVEAVMAAIAALTIPDVTIRGESGVADSMLMSAHTFAPRPEKFITGVQLKHAEMTEYNNNFYYTLHYRYYHCALEGGLGGLAAMWPGLIKNVASILVAFSSHLSLGGTIDQDLPTVETLGPVMDPAGNQYLGAEISILVLQFLES